MFITEEQIALYKYKDNSRYYAWSMAEIAVFQFDLIGGSASGFDIFKYLSSFYHRLIDIENSIWEFRFSDGSFILVKCYEDNKVIYIDPCVSRNNNERFL